jgi:CRP-like cAMP-binding protein
MAASPAAKIDDLRELPRLARISPQLFELLFGGCKAERYAAGQHLFVQEDVADRMYGVIAGTVEISIYSPGGQKLVANIELAQSLIGEIAVLDGGPEQDVSAFFERGEAHFTDVIAMAGMAGEAQLHDMAQRLESALVRPAPSARPPAEAEERRPQTHPEAPGAAAHDHFDEDRKRDS